mmetsp:Transcript_24481/g.61199  ORF Transcript_24481/g.61199 Transcript_24481/m.61199 type:complete len:358 (-) Transcript_24481:1161-2234(-)
MPILSGSLTSLRKACAKMCNSNRNDNMAQSSIWYSLKRGVSAPTFKISSTPNTSRASKSMLSSSSSFSSSSTSIASVSSFFSSFSSPSFFSAAFFAAAAFLASLAAFAAAFFATTVLYSANLLCQALTAICHLAHCWLNHVEGCKSSMRMLSFLSKIHFFTYSSHLAPLVHSYLMSSKPSSLVGRVNLVNEALITTGVRSLVSRLTKDIFFSSAVNSALGGSSSFSSSSASSFSSSSSSFSSSSSSNFSPFSSAAFFLASRSFCFFSFSAFFLSFSISFCFCSIIFFRFSSNFFALNCLSEASCFCCNINFWLCFLNSTVGSPTTTQAIFLKAGDRNRSKRSFRSSSIRFPLTSMTM